MRNSIFPRRSFFGSLFALPFGLTAQSRQGLPSAPTIAKVGSGAGRFNSVGKLPGGDLLYVKVATQDARGALFMTEQPIERAGSGPPKHYHEYQDEWFYCLAGEYLFEIGDQRFRLAAGESVLGPGHLDELYYAEHYSGQLLR